MRNFGKRKFRISKARGFFIASTILVGAAFLFPYFNSSFPSSRVKVEQQATIPFLNDDFPGGLSSKLTVSNFQRGFNFVIELPDNEAPLDPSLKGKAWQLANTSQVLTLKEIREGRTTSVIRPLPSNTTGANGTSGESSPVCSPLCGRHGWGECKKGTRCVCPVFYDGIDCMKGIDLPKQGPLWKVEAKYVGDLTMNRRSLEGHKWIVGCIPEKLHEPDLGHRVLGTVTPRLLNSMPIRDPFAAGKVYERCAIVGSSGISLHYTHGEEISQHDLVMRFNSAPRQGYEQHVGNKTTVRVTNVHNWGFFEHSSEMVLVPIRSRAALDALIRVRQHSQPRNRQANTLGISPDFIRYVASSFDFLPSAGLLGIFIALQRCNMINLYGFHGYRENNISYHYYDSCARPTDEDRDRREYGVVNKLAKLGLLNWRDPCIQVCHDQKAKCANCLHHHHFQQLNSTTVPPECPACSFTKEGCKLKHHWAFRNKHSRLRHPRKNNLKPAGITDRGGEGSKKAEGMDIDNVQDNENISTNNSSGKRGSKTRRGAEDGRTVDEKLSARVEDKRTGEDVEEDAAVEDTMTEEDEKEETENSKQEKDGMIQAGKKKKGEEATEDDSEVMSIDTDEEDEYSRKVWPEFPGKKKKKINKAVEGEKANEEAEETVEVMSFTQSESTQPVE